MDDVTIKYKGSNIAEMNASGTKTVETSGKYCEGDITVEYVAKEQNVQRWDVTISTGVPSTSGGTTVYFLQNNAWLKANRSNPGLCIAVFPKFTVQYDSSKSLVQGVYMQSNRALMAKSDGTGQYSLSAYVNSSGGITARMRTYPLTTSNNIGDLCVTESGGLYALATSNQPLAIGEYTVIAFIA